MEILNTFLENLPMGQRLLLLGVLIKFLVSSLRKWKKFENTRKWVKIAVVCVFAALASAYQEANGVWNTNEFLGQWFAFAASAVFINEGWKKVIVSWFGPNKE